MEWKNGNRQWFLAGKFHRQDGPACLCDGNSSWYSYNRLHREDGPAIEWANGSKQWYLNGLSHREDGPAFDYVDGRKLWFLHGIQQTEEEFNQWLMKKTLNAKLQSILPPKPMTKRGKI
ncbi:hypothetical protein GTP27_12495 [Pseudoduganella sp. CY13W]|uniref:Uncharacterized protein n=1 Tax=Duganella qianjiadongensis TaxID=2692176 RepID=A0ABW9VN59_9BURK|nr:hypothetical protein [Duganella qianjiadongensis]